MIKLLLLLLLFSNSAIAGLPPTASLGSGDSSLATTFNFKFPNISVTHAGTTATFGISNVVGGGTGRATLTTNNVILGNGTNPVNFVAGSVSGDALQYNGTTWVSAAIASTGGNYAYYSGYHDSSCNWSRTNAVIGDFNADGSCSLTQRRASGISAAAFGSTTPQLDLTLPRTGQYVVCATGQMYEDASSGGNVRLIDSGSAVLTDASLNGGTSGTSHKTLCGILNATSTSMSVKMQCRSASSTCRIASSGDVTLDWLVFTIPGNAG